MATPTKPDIDYSYTGFQAEQQSAPFPGTQLDSDLAELKRGVDDTIDALGSVRRSDGAVANVSIGYDQLKPELDGFGFNPPTDWATATDYIARDTVFHENVFYRAVESHFSGVFADALAAGKWALIVDFTAATSDAEAAAAAAALDAIATAADRVQTGLDATATAADRVQTGLDATAAATSLASLTFTYLDPDEDTTLSNLGGGAVGIPLFKAATAGAARGAIGAVGVDAAVFGLSTSATGAVNAAAINNALAAFSDVYIAPGTYDIGATLVVPAYKTLRGAGKYVSVLNKTFNGDMLTLGTGSNLETIALGGNGATYTGRGVTIGTGTGSQWITNCRIKDFDDFCVEYTAASAGTQGGIGEGTMVSRTNTGDVCIQYPDDASVASPRFLLGVIGGGAQILCDTGSAQNLFICNCYCSTITTTTGAGKVLIWGTRIATIGATITFRGSNLIVGGCAIAGAVVWGANAGSVFSDTNLHTGFTDSTNSADVGKIHYSAENFTPSWKGDTTDPVIGDGTIAGQISAHGKYRRYTIQVDVGSTTTFGSGNWYFPLIGSNNIAKTTCTGVVYGLDSGTAFVVGACLIAAGDNKIRMVNNGSSNFWSSSKPHTWASGDYFRLAIDIELT